MAYLRCMRGGKIVYGNSLLQYYILNKWQEEVPMPSNIVVMFDVVCPSGWTQLAAIDNKFIQAAAAYNANAGGNANHIHTISNHTHTWSGNTNSVVPGSRTMNAGTALHDPVAHVHTLSVTNVANGSCNTGNGTITNANIQPWVKLIFCRKN